MTMYQRPQIGLLNISPNHYSTITRLLNRHDYNVVPLIGRSVLRSKLNSNIDVIITEFIGDSISCGISELGVSAICNESSMPLVIVLVRNDFSDKEKVFMCGASDYVSLPIIEAELLVRLKAVISLRTQANKDQASTLLGLADKVSAYLQLHLDKDIKLDDLASTFGVNRNKLSFAFKDQFGMTIFSWLRDQRMLKAAELCLSSNLNIQQIAEAVGYADANNFSTCFRRYHGNAPLGYRKVMQKSKKFMQIAKADYRVSM